MLTGAAETFCGELLAMIDPTNLASQRVATKLGFTFWKRATVDGYDVDIYPLQSAASPSPPGEAPGSMAGRDQAGLLPAPTRRALP